MKKIKYIIVILLSVFITSCSDFLDEVPANVITPESTIDFDQILNSQDLVRCMAPEYQYLSDESLIYPYSSDFSDNEKAYYWLVDDLYKQGTKSYLWDLPYQNIYKYNVVLKGVLNSEGGTDDFKKEVLAEAKLGKAFHLFYLANTFCKPFDPATASTDYGMLIVNSIDIADPIPSRGTLQETYDFIISNLKEASLDLPDDNTDKTRGSKLACYSLLARVYYYMLDYTNAELYADKALAIRGENDLVDLNTISSYTQLQLSGNTEEYYLRAATGHGLSGPNYNFVLSTELQATYDPVNDLRLRIEDDYTGKFNYFSINRYGELKNERILSFGPNVQEMMLIKAEAKARVNDLSEALTLLNKFLRTRMDVTTYVDLSSTNQTEVLSWIQLERKKELYFRGLRWFDMRKASKEGIMPTISRDYEDYYNPANNQTYILEGNSKKYTLLIPEIVLSYNPNMPQNER